MCILHYVFMFVILHNKKYFLQRLYIFLRCFFTLEIREKLQNVKLWGIDGKIEGVKNNYSSHRMTNSQSLYNPMHYIVIRIAK